MTEVKDEKLVESVLAGERAAYGQLYDRYAPLVRAVCYDGCGNLADAQDLAQDVFVRGFEKLSRLRQADRFGKWIVGIARVRCKEWRREMSRSRSDKAALSEADMITAEEKDSDSSERLIEAIRSLPEKERLAMHSFYLQGRSADKARAIMGLSRSGFYKVLERGRKRLAKVMADELENI